MPDKGTLAIDELLNALDGAGFGVVSVGTRYRVTNPKGGKPAFIPNRLPRGAKMEQIMNGLLAIGFNVEAVAQAREADRQARLKLDRDRADRLMAEASERPRPTPADVRAAVARAATPASIEPVFVAPPNGPVDIEGEPITARATPQTRTEVIEMDPSFARDLLAANRFYDEGRTQVGRCNRKFKPWLAERYAKEMLAGNWVLIHAGIALDTEGELLDGQHRLAALVIAGEIDPTITVPLSVTYDLAPESGKKMDIGKGKSLADILSMNGMVDVNHVSALCRLITYYTEAARFVSPTAESVPAFTMSGFKNYRVEADDVLRMTADDPTLAGRVRDGRKMHKIMGVTPASFAWWLLISEGWDEGEVEGFMLTVRDGAGLETTDPRYALRETLLNRRNRTGTHRDSIETVALVIKAWKLHRKGAEFRGRGLAWRKDEDFPRAPKV